MSELGTGERGVIVKVSGHGSFRKRIREMGFVRGNKVKVILNAPLRDPIEYEIIGYKISLRREEASEIEVISESEAKKLLTEREALLLVSALGVFQNRIGQHGSWQKRKRMVTLRHRLADCLIVGDRQEAESIMESMNKCQREQERLVTIGQEANTLRKRIKQLTGITDVRLRDDE